jgi:FkbM family methyltransferase
MLGRLVDRLARFAHEALASTRRRLVRFDVLNRRLPWRLWCAVAAADALAVSWVVARRAGRPLVFVQIGANDGVTHDPLHVVVRACNWSGLLVEPVPAMYERLVANYAGVPGLAFENAAVGPVDGTATLYSVDPRPGDPYWVELISTFDRSTIFSHRDVLDDVDTRIAESEVATLTLPTLVSRHGLASIDLLNVDVEGYDLDVLQQVDFQAPWAPTFIIYEREHLEGPADAAARRLLRRAGYRWVDIWPDALAYRAAPESLGGIQGRPGRVRFT